MKTVSIKILFALCFASLLATTAFASEKCKVHPQINDWKTPGRRYAFILELNDREQRFDYFVIYSNKWNLSDEALSKLVKKKSRNVPKSTSTRLVFSPENPTDFDFNPRRGKVPGMAGPGRDRFELARFSLCKQ